MKFVVDITMEEGADPIVVADHILDTLCGHVWLGIESVDGCDPMNEMNLEEED